MRATCPPELSATVTMDWGCNILIRRGDSSLRGVSSIIITRGVSSYDLKALQLGYRPCRLNGDRIADLYGVARVVREEFLRAYEILLILRVLDIAVDFDRGRILHRRLHDGADECLGAESFCFHRLFRAPYFTLRASKGSCRLFRKYACDCLAKFVRSITIFGPSAGSRKALGAERLTRLREEFLELCIGLCYHGNSFCHRNGRKARLLARDDGRLDRQLHARLYEMCACDSLVDTVELEENATRPHLEDIVLRVALAASHTDLCGLRRHRSVREDAYPELTRLRGGARKHLACRLDLIARHARAAERLEREGAERDGGAARFWTVQALLALALCLPLAMFYFLREQHGKKFKYLLAAGRSLRQTYRRLLVLVDIAAEYPHLDADDAIGQIGLLVGEVDVRTEGLEWNAALLELLLAAHLRAAEPARDGDAHALALPRCDDLLDRLLQYAAERHPLLKSLGNHRSDDRRIRLRLTYLVNVELHRAAVGRCHRAHYLREFGAQLGGVLAGAPDDETGTRGRDDNSQFGSRAFYLDAARVGAAQLLRERPADRLIDLDILAVTLRVAREPAALPVPDDAETMCIRMDGVGHINYLSVTIIRLLRRRMSEARPKARGMYFFSMPALSTMIDCTVSVSGSSPRSFAEAAALLMSFATGSEARFGRNCSAASAAGTFFPFTRSVTKRTLRGV